MNDIVLRRAAIAPLSSAFALSVRAVDTPGGAAR